MSNKPKATAKRSRSTKSTKATKATKRKATATKRTKATPEARSAKVRQASAPRSKPFYGTVTLAEALAKADSLPTLRSARLVGADRKVPMSGRSAEARREFAEAIGAPIVAVWTVAHATKVRETKGVGTISDRPENAIRSRIRSWAKAEGKPEDYYYAIRAEAYAEGIVPTVYIVRL